ncbi:hypothetical protein ACHAWT_001817 [Skeletonema menzelii]
MSICVFDPEMPTTPVEKTVYKQTSFQSSDDASSSAAPVTPQSPSAESREDQPQRGNAWNRYNQNRRRVRNKPRHFGPRNTEMRPYHSPTHVSPPHDKPMTKNDIYFALDCEMVGVGPEGLESAVARVTLCNWAEEVILDTFVKVPVEVTDYRTFVSGIEAKDLEGEKAMPLKDVQEMVQKTLHGKILIGHALENDLKALQITHPWHDTRDSAIYPPFMQEVPDLEDSSKSSLRPRKLKELVKDRLGNDIQELGKAHDPVEDALSALRLYKAERLQWEQFVVQKVAAAKVQEPRPYALEHMPPPSPIPYTNHLGSPTNMNMPMNMNMNMNMGMNSPNRNRYQPRNNFQPRTRAFSVQHHQQHSYGGSETMYGGYNQGWVRHRSY